MRRGVEDSFQDRCCNRTTGTDDARTSFDEAPVTSHGSGPRKISDVQGEDGPDTNTTNSDGTGAEGQSSTSSAGKCCDVHKPEAHDCGQPDLVGESDLDLPDHGYRQGPCDYVADQAPDRETQDDLNFVQAVTGLGRVPVLRERDTAQGHDENAIYRPAYVHAKIGVCYGSESAPGGRRSPGSLASTHPASATFPSMMRAFIGSGTSSMWWPFQAPKRTVPQSEDPSIHRERERHDLRARYQGDHDKKVVAAKLRFSESFRDESCDDEERGEGDEHDGQYQHALRPAGRQDALMRSSLRHHAGVRHGEASPEGVACAIREMVREGWRFSHSRSPRTAAAPPLQNPHPADPSSYRRKVTPRVYKNTYCSATARRIVWWAWSTSLR
nr:hypothetical protein CFP56_65478 [Quercus suber]